MKMKKEHYSIIEHAMHRATAKDHKTKEQYKQEGRSKGFYAWSIFNSCNLLKFQCNV